MKTLVKTLLRILHFQLSDWLKKTPDKRGSELPKTIIPFALVENEVIITNELVARVGYLSPHIQRAHMHEIIVIYLKAKMNIKTEGKM